MSQIRYDYLICPDCGNAYAVQVDEDDQPIVEPKRTHCYACQVIAPDVPVVEWRRGTLMLADLLASAGDESELPDLNLELDVDL